MNSVNPHRQALVGTKGDAWPLVTKHMHRNRFGFCCAKFASRVHARGLYDSIQRVPLELQLGQLAH